MIYIKPSYRGALTEHQQELIDKGYKILDITVIHNGYHNGFAYFIKYTKV